MTDFATLAIKIDSSETKDATRNLDDLAKAGKRTEDATNQLGRTARTATREMENIGHTAGNSRIAMMEFSHVITASSDAFAAGIPISRIFATEIGRVSQAATLMGSGLGGVASFLGGPWGLAITGAVSVLGSLAAAHFGAAKASDDHKHSAEDLIKALYDLSAAATKATQSTEASIVAQINDAAAKRENAIQTRNLAVQELQLEKARTATDIAAANRIGQGLGKGGLEIAATASLSAAAGERAMAALDAQIKSLNGAIDAGSGAIRKYQGQILEARLHEHLDAAAAATGRFKRASDELYKELGTGKITLDEFGRKMFAAQKAEEAAKEATKKGAAAHKEHAAALTDDQRAYNKQFDATERYIDSLTREVAEIGKTPEQIKQMEIARQREAAQTAAQRKEIDKLTVSRAIELALLDRKNKAKEWAAISQDVESALAEEQKKNEEAIQRQRMDNIQTLADFYETAFHDGAKGIWKDFKNQGLRIIAEIAAAYTLALINGQQASLPGILSQINVGGGQFGLPGMILSSVLGKKSSAATGGLGLGSGGLNLGAGTVGDFLGGGGGGVGESSGGIGNILGGNPPTSATSRIGAGNLDLGSLLGGAGIGFAAGSAIGGTGAKIGGTLGGAAGMAIGGPIGAAIGSLIGSAIGKLVGGLFKKTKKGSATLGFTDGELGVGSAGGNSSSRIGASKDAIGSVADALNQIADALGGTITGAGSVSIGVRKKSYRVDTTGAGRTKGAGVLDFGQDQEAAIRAAIADALSDGVIGGISDASKRILSSGQKLETAIEKASLIEQIPKLLKQRLDPVGAALDDLNKQWDKVWAALKEGQATTEQYAQAQQLYNLELQDVKDNTKGASSALKDFIDSLNFGSNSPYSLMDQESAVKAKLQPFLDQIAGGGTVDQQKYLDTAQSFLDIERQLYGSTPQFFDALNLVKDSTSHLIDKIDNVTSIGSDALAQATADNTAQTASNTAATADILTELRNGVMLTNDQLAQIAAALGPAKYSDFIGNATGFASAA